MERNEPPAPYGAARHADRFELYERAVQEPDHEVALVDELFRGIHHREAVSLREDFCGTAVLCREWVSSAPARRAIGIDRDPGTLDYALARRVEPLGAAADRIELVCADVCETSTPPVDVVVAFNFAYCLIHSRRDVVRYFSRVRSSLTREGAFILDFHAGPLSQEPSIDETEFEDFTYVWEQGEMDAASGGPGVTAEALPRVGFVGRAAMSDR